LNDTNNNTKNDEKNNDSSKTKEATLDITVAFGTDLLSKIFEYAQNMLESVFKSSADDIAGLSAKLVIPIQIVTVSAAKVVTKHGYDAIKISIAIRSGDPNAVAEEIFSAGVGVLAGSTVSLGIKVFAPGLGLVASSGVGAFIGWWASEKAKDIWKDVLAKSAIGEWSIAQISETFNIGVKITPNTMKTPQSDVAPLKKPVERKRPYETPPVLSTNAINFGSSYVDMYVTRKVQVFLRHPQEKSSSRKAPTFLIWNFSENRPAVLCNLGPRKRTLIDAEVGVHRGMLVAKTPQNFLPAKEVEQGWWVYTPVVDVLKGHRIGIYVVMEDTPRKTALFVFDVMDNAVVVLKERVGPRVDHLVSGQPIKLDHGRVLLEGYL
jgi:hypothetical protein